jgi:hypothetical protein
MGTLDTDGMGYEGPDRGMKGAQLQVISEVAMKAENRKSGVLTGRRAQS